ncbi:DNA kinase/phosphatase Pnk1 [Marasmius tenuissimus]|uniref:DNA kinase/phosphatase Pnk1 n=1 Tax=Marasmius tenuissimus TaxID=585030 RepID=A0ABR2ZK22_9AGAR|nr:DNA kinase/phosphatase Pnk1 [Marasmius tenuissimus]
MASSSSSSSSKKRTAKDAELDSGGKAAKKIHPFFTREAKEPEQHGTFKWLKPLGPKSTCLHGVNLEPPSRSKVALFDLDGTIIKTSFGSKDATWEWWRLQVPAALKKLHDDGYSVVIISNQALKAVALKAWKEKVPSIATSLSSLPFRILAATAKDYYRKPMIGMWTELTRIFKEDGVEIDKSGSFFVGDAAGRQYPNGKSDFSGTDRKWASNIGLTFHTPEEYFLGLPVHANFKLEGFHVSSLTELPPYTPTHTALLLDPRIPEIVLFVGFPSLGKTSFYNRYFKPADYVHINQDILGSRPKCIKAVDEALNNGLACVIDNTNRDAATRKHYVDLARKRKVPIRCFHFTGSMELAWHNNLYRAFNMPPSVASNEPKRELVPYLAYTSYKGAFQEPELSEGFSEIKKINWVFEGDEEVRRHWSMWHQLEGK